jgi:hypothetical protein
MIVSLSCIEVAARVPTRHRLEVRPTDGAKGQTPRPIQGYHTIWVPGMKYLSTVASLRRNRRVKQFTVVCFEKCAACH